MDTVTYPDKAVQEITRNFVCVRVDVDAQKDLAKRYGVEPITDIRLLDPDGTELDRLVGFTGAAKLAARCQAALDRLAGKGGNCDRAAGPFAKAAVEPSPAAILASTKKALAFLKSSFDAGWTASDGFAPDDLVLYAWASAGVDPHDEKFMMLRDRMFGTGLTGTYQAAFRALAYSRLDSILYGNGIETCATFLVDSQLENGQWTYRSSAPGAAPGRGDNSNSAYALLGLAACRKAAGYLSESSLKRVEATLQRAEAAWRSSQNADGGWGYRTDRETASYASMTESGLSSLILLGKAADPAASRASAWLKDNFAVAENRKSAYQQGRLLYHLYSLERVGTLSGGEALPGHDWYKEGAGLLLANQKDDGSWDDGAETPVPNTCFALLFLSKSTSPLK